jgi:hypothetical protein
MSSAQVALLGMLVHPPKEGVHASSVQYNPSSQNSWFSKYWQVPSSQISSVQSM